MVRHSQQLNDYIAENLNSSQKSHREFCSFLTMTNVSFQKGTTLKVDMKQVPVLQIYNKLQKGYVQLCWQKQEEVKNEKENLPDNMIKKHLQLGSTVTPCSKQMPRPLCLVCFQIYQKWNLPNMLVSRHFHSKHSNLQGKPLDSFQRLVREMNSQKSK